MNQKTGLQRNLSDKYYTSKEIVKKCMSSFTKLINVEDDDLCIEPSAGNGSFINEIKKTFNKYYFYDIYPENELITKLDYLKFEIKDLNQNCFKKIHVIGNPPFGRQSSLAIKFIKKSSQFCDSISFILPKSFKKDSLKKHFPLNFHLIEEYELPENSFEVNKLKYNVPCVFQIWIKKNTLRKLPIKLKPIEFKFVKKNVKHDLSFRRVGVYAGKIDTFTVDKSPQSHYFIKFEKKINDIFLKELSKINYKSKNNTVGPKSISKQELIKEFNNLIKNYNF
tara:strand:- start:2018 stop:2857 length:840 start_codon:yes stop_codon:yes gene_type:complete